LSLALLFVNGDDEVQGLYLPVSLCLVGWCLVSCFLERSVEYLDGRLRNREGEKQVDGSDMGLEWTWSWEYGVEYITEGRFSQAVGQQASQ
jgi:hypothetical protein